MAKMDAACAEAMALLKGGQAERAAAVLRRAAQKEPGNVEVNHLLGLMLGKLGQGDQSQYFLDRAAKLAPGDGEIRRHLLEAYIAFGKPEKALALAAGAAKARPEDVTARAQLVRAHLAMDDAEGAAAAGREACERFTARAELVRDFMSALFRCGRMGEFIAVAREGRRIGALPEGGEQSLAMAMNYADSVTAEEVFEEHVWAGRILAARHPIDARPFGNARDPERALRVGYVSQGYRDRAAAHFVGPILAHHDPERVRAVCYSNGVKADEMTARLKSLAAGWVEVRGMTDRALAERVRADGIDVFVDLTGYTGHNRLGVFGHRPAPVQVTYMGYPNTTGLPTMDYRIVDSITDPPGAERLATERLVRLDPCFLCFGPARDAPEVSGPPSAGAGRVTFGSFNTHAKMSPSCVELWARLVREVPGSRLFLKNRALGDAGVAERARAVFEARGVERSRLELRGETESKVAHLASYAEVDVAVDPFPYNGTTTTMEAMWMGVPVVVMSGSTHVSRVGMTLLEAVGLRELIARDGDEYVRIARDLAGDVARRREMRLTMRERLRGSPVCDAPGFVRRLDAAYREMWRAWCASGR